MGSENKRSKQGGISPAVNVNDPENEGQAAPGKTVTTVDSLPSQMLEYIFEFSSDINTLKTWRLVSKSWNEVCCRILQKISAVSLNVGEGEGEDLEEFKDFMLDRHADFPPDWPNPFQNFKLVDTSVVSQNLVRFLQRRNVKITTLEIVHGSGFDPLIFKIILERIKGELNNLKINGNSDSVHFLTLTDTLRNGGWRSLKKLTLKDTCTAPCKPCPHVKFIIALKTHVRLEGIHLDGEFVNMTTIFEEKDDCWHQLTRLEIESSSPPPSNVTPAQRAELMKWAEKISFPPLTHLTVWFDTDQEPSQTSKQLTPYILPLIQRSSRVIEVLHVNFMRMNLLPRLPKLKHVTCAVMDRDRIQEMTQQKFPSLLAVDCLLRSAQVPTYTIPNELESNKTVKAISVDWSPATLTKVSQELLWSILKAQFPNVKMIEIQRNVSSSTLYVIRKRFPGLRYIQLRAITASELLGTSSVPDFTAKGWPCEAFENCALVEMTELIHLTLGKYVTVSKDIITACLGKLSKIRSLCFHWNDSLQPFDISEHLGHIQDVTVLYTDGQQKRELEKLATTMKSLKLVKTP